MIAQPSIELIDFTWADPELQRRLADEPAEVLRDHGLELPEGLPDHVLLEVARLVLTLWNDGRIIPRQQFWIDPADEGLLFGRGVWESTRTIAGVPWHWPMHLDRLRQTAALLDIPLDPTRLPDEAAVEAFVRSLTTMDVIIRLNVTAGRAGRPGAVWMTASLPPTPMSALRLKTGRYPFEKGHPYLTWKTFQYASRLRIGRQAARTGYDSVLLIDDDNLLLEAAHANIFCRFESGWATPKADGGLLPGTVRRYLLDHSPWPIIERPIALAEIAHAHEVFVTNSNVGIIPVTQIDQHSYPVGTETLEMASWLPAAG